MSKISTVAPDPKITLAQAVDLGRAALSRRLNVESYGLSDRGRVRTRNEDQFLIAELAKAMRVKQSTLPQPETLYGDERGHLFLVADGVGGRKGGSEASALAVGSIEDYALNTLKWFFRFEGSEEQSVLAEFKHALRYADAQILEAASQHPELHGMGTTVTLAYCLGAALFVIHVGDSRCYVLRRGGLYRLTQDHTLVAEMVRCGTLRPEQAARHQLRNVITNVVGGDRPGLHVEVHKLELEPNDVVLLCSDGLTEMLSDERIAAVVAAEEGPRAACQRLVAEANASGGHDNITVVAARFTAPELPREVPVVTSEGGQHEAD